MASPVAPAVPKQPATAPVTTPYDKPLAGWRPPQPTPASVTTVQTAPAALAIPGSVGVAAMTVEGMAPLDGDGATQVILTAQGRRLLAERAQLVQAALDDHA